MTSGANPVGLRQGIDKAVKVAVEALHDISQKLKIKMKLLKGAISAADEEIGQYISEAMDKVGMTELLQLKNQMASILN